MVVAFTAVPFLCLCVDLLNSTTYSFVAFLILQNIFPNVKKFETGLKRSPLKSSNVAPFQPKPEISEPGNNEKSNIPDVSTLKSLIIREVPLQCNKNTWLRRFYSKFGDVVKVLCNVNKESATVTFRTHVSHFCKCNSGHCVVNKAIRHQ